MKELDKNHPSKRATLKAAGIIILLIGFGFLLVGTVDFFRAFGGGGPPKLFWCNFIGLPLMFVGGVLSSYGFMGSVARYSAGEMAPVAKDTINYMVGGTKDSVKTVAAAIGEGLAAAHGTGGGATETKVRCPKCNHAADVASKFCPECGHAILKTKPCPACQELNDGDAKFCDNCGKALM